MAKKTEPVDDLLDALVWMRRKAKRHEAVDDLIDALMKMRRKAKKKLAKGKRPAKKRTKSNSSVQHKRLLGTPRRRSPRSTD
jgi:ClpP class serine protease